MILHTAQGMPVELGAEAGRGGEATVYRVVGQPNLLAKIYSPEPRPNYPSKLAWMILHRPENPTAHLNHASLAWPDNLLFDSKRGLRGYCMPFVDQAVPLLDVFNPRRREHILPQFDRRYLHRTARNLAAALGALHRSGYVAGDVNESNVLVTPAALVTLIDTDSFQVREKRGGSDIVYPCPVGKPEYTPPELQGKSLAEVVRVPDHDTFGLAVLIFQLLMGGSHPFRAKWLGQGDPPPLEKRIADGDFPYAQFHSIPIAPPPNAPDLDTLHPWLGELFRRCFIDGHRSPRWRPSPELWVKAIDEAEAALVCCSEGHFYTSQLSTCPYCAGQMRRATGRSSAVPVSATPVERGRRANRPAGGNRWAGGAPARPQPGQPQQGVVHLAGASSSTASSTLKAGASQATLPGTGRPFWSARPQSSFASPWGRWPGAAAPSPAGVTSAAGATAVSSGRVASVTTGPSRPGMPAGPGGWGSFGPSGMLRSRLVVTPAAARAWLRQWIASSFIIGGGQGALAGFIPGALVAFLCWAEGAPFNWSLIFLLGGAAGGLLRGWQPGYQLAELIDRHLGWKRFLQGAGLVLGAACGTVLGMLISWAVIPVILGLVLGARAGAYVGSKVWQLGSGLGWVRIWAGISGLMAAGIGLGAAKLFAEIGLNLLGEKLSAGLALLGGGDLPLAMLWLFAGGASGALFGAFSGVLVDLGGRLARLTK